MASDPYISPRVAAPHLDQMSRPLPCLNGMVDPLICIGLKNWVVESVSD